MKRTGAEIIITLLERQGITTIAGIPGGANLPLYDALYKSTKIRHVLARHEQGAGFIAQGMARASGRTAVCFATSGPGATNLATALADARLDSVPIVAITGQVASSLIGTDAFQEIDTYGMTIPLTKHNFLVRSAAELLEVIPQAFAIAASGRPGPVLVDVPKDVQCESLAFDGWPEPGAPETAPAPAVADLRTIAEMLAKARRPLIYAGGGIISADAAAALRALAQKNSIPVATTLMGLGSFPSREELYLGMLGMHGERSTNLLLDRADLLLAFGARFDDRATGRIDRFCSKAAVVHVDIDRAEIDKLKRAAFSFAADIRLTLEALLPLVAAEERGEWRSEIAAVRAACPSLPLPEEPLHPANILRGLSALSGPETVVTTDVGQHQMWAAQHWQNPAPRGFLTSGGLGTMGFGLPAAIGAALAFPERRVLCVTGDGSLLMNVQELATLAELDANVTVVVMNNGHLGLVRQQQELFYGGNYIASRFAMNPDFAAMAKAFGIRSVEVKGGSAGKILAEAVKGRGPCLVDIHIPMTANVLPMVPPGAALHETIGGEHE